MTSIGASSVRGLAPVLALTLVLTGCGSAGSAAGSDPSASPPGSSAPLGIGSVTWPTDRAAITELVTTLPSTQDRWTSTGVESDDSSVGRTYTDSSGDAHYPNVNVLHTDDGETPAASMMGLLMWAGGPEGCIDWSSSPAFADLPRAAGSADLGAIVSAAPTGPTEKLWIQCTSVVNVDGGPGTLPPTLWEYLLVWAAGDWVYVVDGRSAEMRQTMTEQLIAGVG